MLKFASPLKHAVILSRPNRFLMEIHYDGCKYLAHCPSTGRIGDIKFNNIPCLISESDNKSRKTKFTVEAIAFPSSNKNEHGDDESNQDRWIGINQSKVNTYIKHLLVSNQLVKIISVDSRDMESNQIKTERKVGKSRLDFQINNCYLEVKMPLINLEVPDHIERLSTKSDFNSFERLIKHFNELQLSLQYNTKAYILLVYAYDAKPFQPPALSNKNKEIMSAAAAARAAGVENWQVNLKINEQGVSLRDYFQLSLSSSH